jgi:hypothetical protein
VYTKIERDEFVRVVDEASFAYEDGDEAPQGEHHKARFETVEFRTFRRAYPWRLGYLAIDQATLWKPKIVHMQAAVSKAMTNRTNRVVTLLETASNWSGNTATANTLNAGAGKWDTASDDPSDSHFEAIYKSLIESARRIHLATNGKVKPKDMRVVVSPDLAIKISQAPEIINYVRETPQAVQIIKDGLSGGQDDLWGMPERYRGFKFVVEDAMYVSTSPKASGTEAVSGSDRVYCKASTSAVIVSRPGGLDGEYGSQSFSTVQLYHYEGLLKVRAFDDPENDRVKGRVEENIKEVLAAPVSGYLIQGTL